MRDIKLGPPTIGRESDNDKSDLFKMGYVGRQNIRIAVCNLEGRKTDNVHTTMGVNGGQCWGLDGIEHNHGFEPNLGLLKHVRVIYVDVRRVRRCSVDDAEFHHFIWPRCATDAESIMGTLFVNHCKWYGLLIVRGRCVCSHTNCLTANRVLDNLLRHRHRTGRPYVIYKEDGEGTGGRDPAPKWLEKKVIVLRVVAVNAI